LAGTLGLTALLASALIAEWLTARVGSRIARLALLGVLPRLPCHIVGAGAVQVRAFGVFRRLIVPLVLVRVGGLVVGLHRVFVLLGRLPVLVSCRVFGHFEFPSQS
jgi:hypothetical protein